MTEYRAAREDEDEKLSLILANAFLPLWLIKPPKGILELC